MIKVLKEIDLNQVISAYKKLEPGITWVEFDKGKQTSLQYKEGEDPWTSSTGKSRGKEREFKNLNPYFKNSLFEIIINQYRLTRTRLMWIYPGSCYSMHTDETQRLHIPIYTNDQAFLVFRQGGLEHMPAGYVYIADTTKEHTAMNCSMTEPRLHFVGAIES